MSFALLLPKALWIAAAALPLILLYILKTRRTKVRVASSAMYELARREAAARDPWKKLIPELALLLQLLALILLAIAFARPVTNDGSMNLDAVVIVIDRSASMGARVRTLPTDPAGSSPTRLSRAKQEALKLLDQIGVGADVGVVLAGRDARVVSPLQRAGRSARDAVAGTEVGLIEGDLEPALDVARDLLRSHGGHRRVVLITDGAYAHPPIWLDEEHGSELEIKVVPAPEAGESREGNVGIVRLDARRSQSEAGDHVDVGIILGAYGQPEGGKNRYVTLRRLDRPTALDAQKVEVGPSGRAAATLGFTPAADGSDELATLIVEIEPNDALPLDDFAEVVVPPPRRMPVVLASLGVGGGSYIGKALGADPDVSLTKITPDKLLSTPIAPWALVVVADSCPTTIPGGGDVLIVNPPPGPCAGRIVGQAVSQKLPPITSWSPTDPRLRYVDLEGIELGRVVPIAPAGTDPMQGASVLGASALVRAEQLAVMADASTLDRTVTIWGFDPTDGKLATKAAFVLMVRDAVDYARSRRDRSWAPSTRAGIPARVTATAGATEIVARRLVAQGQPGAGDIAARAPVLEGVAVLEGVDEAGPYALEGAATGAPLTVSLLSDQESDIDRTIDVVRNKVAAPADAPVKVEGVDPKGAKARADLRWLVAAAAVLFLALDALWLTRKGRRVVARLARASAKAPGRG